VNTMRVGEWNTYQILLALWGFNSLTISHAYCAGATVCICRVSYVNNMTTRRIASSSDAVTQLTKQDTNKCTNTFMG